MSAGSKNAQQVQQSAASGKTNTFKLPKPINVGINYPWGHDPSGKTSYGWDFGPSPYGSPPFWKSRIANDLKLFHDLRIFAVRWFILGDGLNYGTGKEVMPPPLHPQFVSDFEKLLKEFEKFNKSNHPPIKLVPSLIDFHWCAQPQQVRHGAKVVGVKGGRSEFIRPAKRKAFFKNVLIPLLDTSNKHPGTIFAWELINEPEPCITGSKEGDSKNLILISKNEMLEFIEEGIDLINKAALKANPNKREFESTIGYRRIKSNDQWKLKAPYLGVTLRQFHYYTPKGSESLPIFDRRTPISFVGEFSTNPKFEKWTELKKMGRQDTVYQRLKLIAEKGYKWAFLWSANPWSRKDQRTDWPQSVPNPPTKGSPQYGVWRYTHGK